MARSGFSSTQEAGYTTATARPSTPRRADATAAADRDTHTRAALHAAQERGLRRECGSGWREREAQGRRVGRPQHNVSDEEITALAHLPLRLAASLLGVSKSFFQGWRLARPDRCGLGMTSAQPTDHRRESRAHLRVVCRHTGQLGSRCHYPRSRSVLDRAWVGRDWAMAAMATSENSRRPTIDIARFDIRQAPPCLSMRQGVMLCTRTRAGLSPAVWTVR